MDVQSSEKVILLHGDLDLKIIEAQNLPNMDLFTERLRRCFTVCDACTPHSSANEDPMHSHGGSDNRKIKHHRRIITSDPYVKVVALEATLARTRVITNTQNPEWNENFKIPMAHPVINLEFLVKDSDVFGAQLIGRVLIPASQIAAGEVISRWFQILGPSRDAKLHLEMKFTPCDKNQLYHRGIADDPEHNGVRNTYFPLRKGGLVTLYRDAHVLDGMMPQIELDDGDKVFQHENCWEDICNAILEAHHLIYLVGWSIYHEVRLTRKTPRTWPSDRDWTLGELLKYKSEEGVRVLLLVWDDKTSHDKYLIKTEGVMQTHDEETRRFFKHSSVICVLSPRYASNKLSYIKQQVVGTFFTHHQKCVLVDTQAHGNCRKITAFLGGLDLCDGRYDTPEHRLFRDLNDVFKDDFHNPAFAAGIKAPRQPWHDLHCKIEGPAAYDVLINFEQRWRKATRWREFGLGERITHWHDDALLKIGRISWILSPVIDNKATVVPGKDPNLWVSNEENRETCHVQIFRSIDSGSAKDFPMTVDAAQAESLICSKNVVMDKSIQIAYIQAIRSAQHFIYIENQYFIGSSYAWPSYKNAGADNLIPMELALKIASKIRANERFAVYIVIPMWPEGDPESAAVQEILLWQGQTMQMMYDIVARELESMHLIHSHPQDYLNFYCLGKREEIPGEMLSEENQTATSGVAASKVSDSFKFRRFMIYVHAKGMVVDDEYVIVGSANINERSLAGTRDTEIAMGAYQPHHCCAKAELPRGQVYGYRMSLWAEHLGMLDESFKRPDSIECLRKVNEVAEGNWKRYAAKEFSLLQGHLIKYPLKVGKDGKVASLPNHETFPDFRGKILGDKYPTLPDDLTT